MRTSQPSGGVEVSRPKGALVVTQAPGCAWRGETWEAAAVAFSTDFRAGCPALMGTRGPPWCAFLSAALRRGGEPGWSAPRAGAPGPLPTCPGSIPGAAAELRADLPLK